MRQTLKRPGFTLLGLLFIIGILLLAFAFFGFRSGGAKARARAEEERAIRELRIQEDIKRREETKDKK